MNLNNLAARLRMLAGSLTYNGSGREAAAKHTLHEIAGQIDSMATMERPCLCCAQFSLQSISGGAHPNGVNGSAWLLVDGKRTEYVRRDIADKERKVGVSPALGAPYTAAEAKTNLEAGIARATSGAPSTLTDAMADSILARLADPTDPKNGASLLPPPFDSQEEAQEAEPATVRVSPKTSAIDDMAAQAASWRAGGGGPGVERKPSNPKDAMGDTRVPLALLSPIAKAYWALAQHCGRAKYGAWNWREAGARASVYLSAIQRHADGYLSGERLDPVDGTHHLGNIMACCAILLEAEAAGNLNDDRPPRVGHRSAYAEVESQMAVLMEKYNHG